MKKLLFFLLVSNLGFPQSSIHIRLVDANIGAPLYDWSLSYPIPMHTSNDAGLNAIFSTYGVTSYEDCEGHPYPSYQSKIKVILGNYPTQLLTDLLAYSSVVEWAKVSTNTEFTDALNMQLASSSTGVPTGISNNVVTTNDAGLNAIFTTYNVFYYAQSYPSAPAGHPLLRWYFIVCDCDKNLLKAALDSYTSIIQATENVNGGVILGDNPFEKTAAVIFPNPFSGSFEIQTEATISKYAVFDVTGKELINTETKNALDNYTPQLHPGVYFLNLQFENGQKANYKIVKK